MKVLVEDGPTYVVSDLGPGVPVKPFSAADWDVITTYPPPMQEEIARRMARGQSRDDAIALATAPPRAKKATKKA